MIKKPAASRKITMAVTRYPIEGWIRNAKTMPRIHMIGTGRTIWIHMTKAVWIELMSFKVLVTIEAVPNRSKSAAEKLRLFS